MTVIPKAADSKNFKNNSTYPHQSIQELELRLEGLVLEETKNQTKNVLQSSILNIEDDNEKQLKIDNFPNKTHKYSWKNIFNSTLTALVYLLGTITKQSKSNNAEIVIKDVNLFGNMISLSQLALQHNIIPLPLSLLFLSKLSKVSAGGINKPRQVVVLKYSYKNKKIFFLNNKGSMEHLWLYQPNNKSWNNISPNNPIDLDQNGHINDYSKIENHVISIKGQEKILFLGYSDNNQINLLCYHVDIGLWEKLPSPPNKKNNDIFRIANRYDVIKSDIINIDGKEKLLLLTRSFDGVNLHFYDPYLRYWARLPAGPALSDINGWGDPKYYSTIQTQIIKNKNNQEKLFLIARSAAGIELHSYDPQSRHWERLPSGPEFSDSTGYGMHIYYSTIQTQVIKFLDGEEKLFVLCRHGGGVAVYCYDPYLKAWSRVPEPNSAGLCCYSDKGSWNQEMYYTTIQSQAIKVLDNQKKLFLFSRHSTATDLRYYNHTNNKWVIASVSPAKWSDSAGWTDSKYYSTINSQAISVSDNTDNFLVSSFSPEGIQLFHYDIITNKWNRLPNIPLLEQFWYNPNYYQNKKINYDALCESIKNANVDKVQEILSKEIDLFYDLELKIMLNNYKLYLISTVNESELYKLYYISGNAILLLNDNKVYFIRDGKVKRESTYTPKSIIITDRKGFTTVNNVEPLLQLTGNYKDFIEMVLSQIDIDKNIIKQATNIPIDYYERSPLGLALNLKDAAAEKIIINLFSFPVLFVEINQHLVAYLYLAAKHGGELGIVLIKQLLDISNLLEINIDWQSVIINKHIIDPKILGEKNFFEVAIEHHDQLLIKWILENTFIKSKLESILFDVIKEQLAKERLALSKDKCSSCFTHSSIIKTALLFKNFDLIEKALKKQIIPVSNIILHVKEISYLIEEELYDIIEPYIIETLIKDMLTLEDWVTLNKIILDSRKRQTWDLLNYASEDFVIRVIKILYQEDSSNLITGFFHIIKSNDIILLQRFLSLNSLNDEMLDEKIKNFLLDGNLEETPLTLACKHHYSEITKFLLDNMNPEQINRCIFKAKQYNNITALWISLAFKFQEGILLLINKQDIKINFTKGWHHEFENGEAYTCKRLLDLRAKQTPSTNFNRFKSEQIFTPQEEEIIARMGQLDLNDQIRRQQGKNQQLTSFHDTKLRSERFSKQEKYQEEEYCEDPDGERVCIRYIN